MFSVDRDPRVGISNQDSNQTIEVKESPIDFIKNGCVKLILDNKTMSDSHIKLTSENEGLKRKYDNVYNDASKYFSENHKLKRELTILSANIDLSNDKVSLLMEEVQTAKRERDVVTEEWTKDIKRVKSEHKTETVKAAEEKQKLEKQIAELTKQNYLLINEKNSLSKEYEKIKVSLKQQQQANILIKQKAVSLYSSLKAVNQTSQEALFSYEAPKKVKK